MDERVCVRAREEEASVGMARQSSSYRWLSGRTVGTPIAVAAPPKLHGCPGRRAGTDGGTGAPGGSPGCQGPDIVYAVVDEGCARRVEVHRGRWSALSPKRKRNKVLEPI